MNNSIFSSEQIFCRAYNEGIFNHMKNDGMDLGSFIRVCANAYFDPHVYSNAKNQLRIKFENLVHKYKMAFKNGNGELIQESNEDLLIFLKIVCMGWDKLKSTEKRREEMWNIQFNQIRSFRPRGTAKRQVKGIKTGFDERKFNFNKPFLQNECFWEGNLEGEQISLFYNKYPIVEFHTLLVPDRLKNIPQFIEEKYHRYIWTLTEKLGVNIQGLGFGYNSYGAFASVNHLHFHMFIKKEEFPVMHKDWKHNGGSRNYPSACEVFSSPDESWSYINELHKKNIAYNLLYLPGKICCFPRKKQGTYEHSSWTSGFAWYEMSGSMIVFNSKDYEMLNEKLISNEFAKLSIG
ncbi:hypothetical protein BEH94_04180 [Candidatus Altiarchaeales archaeon WOR_SM1_SCG]|nr:hypothetical protein BEH94_04180 [Candidatus Altiarchaeales archaeon WOR_SM1_SCG]